MITTKTTKGTQVWVSFCDDSGCNKDGFFCQVYADEDLECELDYFVIDAEDVKNSPCPYYTAERLATEYIQAIQGY